MKDINIINIIKFAKQNINSLHESIKLRDINISKEDILIRIHNHTSLFNQNIYFRQLQNKDPKRDKSYLKESDKKLKEFYDNNKDFFCSLPNILDEEVTDENKVIYEKKFTDNINDSLVNKYIQHFNQPIRFVKINTKFTNKLTSIMKNNAIQSGFSEVIMPLMVDQNTLYLSGHLPKFEKELFMTTDNLFLIPTSEVPILDYFCQQPKIFKNNIEKVFCFSNCFRKEAGSYGIRDRFIRLNTFSKLELFIFADLSVSKEDLLNQLVNTACKILEDFKINYRIILNSAKDTSNIAMKTIDIEAWSPSKNCYIELSSCSIIGNYQTLRYVNVNNKQTLNGTALALDRLLFILADNGKKEFFE